MPTKKILLPVFFFLLCLVSATTVLANNPAGAASIGEILPPPGTEQFNLGVPTGNIAIFYFVSRMIRLIMIIAGVWSTIMILLAGYTFITSNGESGSYQKVRNQLTNAVIGLVLIMFTYTLIGLISLILFGDAAFILNPTLAPI